MRFGKNGDAWIQFKIQYYLYALVFIVFDVEVILIFPWAVVFKRLGPVAFMEMAIFLGILFLGLVYVWKKRDLEWSKWIQFSFALKAVHC